MLIGSKGPFHPLCLEWLIEIIIFSLVLASNGAASDIFLHLNHMFFEFKPIRPRSLILSEHELDEIGEFRRVSLLEQIDVVLQGLPMNPRILVSIALILVVKQPSFEDDHTQRPDITLKGIVLSRHLLLL
jgi:hypothetical protein